MRRLLRAYPTLLRVGFAEVVAYRAEFLVWVLTTNMPLIMLGLWSAVALEGPVGDFTQTTFVAYYLGALLVRLVGSSWVVWELTQDIREGAIATRLLRPLHPLWAYSAEHLAAIPMRVLVATPIVGVLLWTAGDQVVRDPLLLGIFVVSIAGAWLINFFTMAIIGTLAMYIESALGVFEVWLGIYALLSGYLIPLDLFPDWVTRMAHGLPFRYMLGFPVETLIGLRTRPEALADLAIQWGYVVGLGTLCLFVWRAGMRRFVAFGG